MNYIYFNCEMETFVLDNTKDTTEVFKSCNFFYFNICHVCKKNREFLKKCSQCKLIYYCSLAHQKVDWLNHRQFCKTVKRILKCTQRESIFYFNSSLNTCDWKVVRSCAMHLTESVIKRPLQPYERHMFWFPLACKVCHSITEKNTLTCEDCLCVTYCSNNHKVEDQEGHKNICHQLKLCLNLDCAMIDYSKYTPIKIPQFIEYKQFPQDINEFIYDYVENEKKAWYFKFLASDLLTCVTTLLYSMEKVDNKLICSKRLSIHVLGAAVLENTLISSIEVLLHWLVNLTDLNIVFVGPECNSLKESAVLCNSCRDKKRVTISYEANLYHNYIQYTSYSKPDVILAFNCGFHEMESSNQDFWKETISQIFKFKKVLTIFTSYTQEEAEKDLLRVLNYLPKDNNSFILNKCIENPFRSLRPLRDWETESLFYLNNYLTFIDSIG